MGAVAQFFASATLSNSSDATEEAWVEGILSFDGNLGYKNESTSWALVNNETSIYASELATATDYYIVKFGNGGISGLNSHYIIPEFRRAYVRCD